ncbi:MAG: hypothetical protein JWP33_1955 [Blastococcus sp.]|nr:hypothetical protein [Blastococcus sp.]
MATGSPVSRPPVGSDRREFRTPAGCAGAHTARAPADRPTDRAGARADGVSAWQLRHLEIVRGSHDTPLPRDQPDDVRARIAAVLLGVPATIRRALGGR